MVSKLGNWAVLSCALALALACSGRTNGNHAVGNASGGSAGKSFTATQAGTHAGDSVVSGGGASVVGGAPMGGAAIAGTPGAGGDVEEMPSAAGDGSGGSVVQPDPDDILKVKPSPGCGKASTQALGEFVKYTIQTSGTKDQNCADKLQDNTPRCGAWSVPRDYYVWLPPAYENTRPYPLVIQAPGCGGVGTGVYSLSPMSTSVGAGANGTVIRVGLTPPPISIGHGTNPGQGCFDDKEGDDSVDFVFYENLIDKLKTELCYDENRVYVSGTSSGAWLANELGCKYAGNADGYAVRAVLVNTGGLPNQPQFSPTCTKKPMAGLWIWGIDDVGSLAIGNKYAVSRAMQLNGCTATDYDAAVSSAMTVNYAIGGDNLASTCQRILGCALNYPLVVCALKGDANGSHESVANLAFGSMFSTLAAK